MPLCAAIDNASEIRLSGHCGSDNFTNLSTGSIDLGNLWGLLGISGGPSGIRSEPGPRFGPDLGDQNGQDRVLRDGNFRQDSESFNLGSYVDYHRLQQSWVRHICCLGTSVF